VGGLYIIYDINECYVSVFTPLNIATERISAGLCTSHEIIASVCNPGISFIPCFIHPL